MSHGIHSCCGLSFVFDSTKMAVIDEMMSRRCYYDILEVERTADSAVLKTAYRRLALQFHPDKNVNDVDKAKVIFQKVKQAYEVLSDPHERAWYDSHRESILRCGSHDGLDESDHVGPDLWRYFSASCYQQVDDSDGGFYTVYRKVFDDIYDSDRRCDDFNADQYPSFGHMTSPRSTWQEFYAFYSAYCTPYSFSWLDQYDTRQAENSKVRKLMERENVKLRDVGKRERNKLVRNLVKFVRKRDMRVADYARELEIRAAQNVEKSRQLTARQNEARQAMIAEAMATKSVEAMSELERDIQQVAEAAADATDFQETDDLYCIACDKHSRNDKAHRTHLKSRQHALQIDELRKMLEASDCRDDMAAAFGASHLAELMKLCSEREMESSAEPAEMVDDANDLVNDISRLSTAGQAVGQSVDVVEDSGKVDSEPTKSATRKSTTDKRPRRRRQKDADLQIDSQSGCHGRQECAAREKSDGASHGETACKVCRATFPSKNQLFKHIKSTGHAALKS